MGNRAPSGSETNPPVVECSSVHSKHWLFIGWSRTIHTVYVHLLAGDSKAGLEDSCEVENPYTIPSSVPDTSLHIANMHTADIPSTPPLPTSHTLPLHTSSPSPWHQSQVTEKGSLDGYLEQSLMNLSHSSDAPLIISHDTLV